MVHENIKVRSLQSDNVQIHKEIMMKLDEDLQSMIVARDELDDQLRASKYQNRVDREEFKRLLQVANQRKVAVQKEGENKSFSHQDANKFSRQTNHHIANSTELLGHDHVSTMMLKGKNRISDILHQSHENEDDAK